jgi:hypothetical protein
MKGAPDPCAGNESQTASRTQVESDAATLAVTGGRSPSATGSSARGHSYVRGSVATATAGAAQPPKLIDGWLCDDANPFGHTVCREARSQEGETPAALVLTFGDGPADVSKRIDVPARVLAWLQTGEVPT